MNDPISNWGNLQTPYSQEAEEATIGAILVNPVMYFSIAAFLTAEDFFILRHRYIWEGLTRLHERGEPIDYVTLIQELKDTGRLAEIGGPAYITQLSNAAPTSVHAEVYGRLIERAATRRRLMAASDEIKALALNEEMTVEQVIADSESRLFNVTERKLTKELIPMRDAVRSYWDRIDHLMGDRNAALGVPSGFKDLDKLLGGFQKSDLIIFAGRPGMGKCVAAGTLITTEHGVVPIEDLLPQNVDGMLDDEGGTFYPLEIGIQTPTGMKYTSHFYDSGLRPTLRFRTRAGYALTGTQVHPVLVLSSTGHKVWKPLSELKSGDYVAVQAQEPIEAQFVLQPNFRSTRYSDSVEQITEYAPIVADLLSPQYYWDEVTSIEDAGVQHCYDLTVPDGHSFVANGIVNHNTSFMLSAALNMARLKQRIAIFSMEMGVEQIVQRLISMEAAINSQTLRLGTLNQQEYSRFVHAAGNLSSFPIYIDDSAALNPLELRTKCLRMQREHGLDLVVVDYLQLMNAGGTYENNRVQEVSYISRNMKELAREFNVPILSAAQLSRAVEQRQDKRPQLSDLRESGSLEQDADIVMFLYRDDMYNEATEFPNQADIIVSKHRNGPTGTISLYFEKTLTKFMNAAERSVDLSHI
ncbi:MAG: replicative DNA helicase [Chloroflexi bacterium]|nr:replicative DNA helicase [Chloroflexota bacterium]MCC6894211.1 replicative DNA helicase [Anaerolineae bacterium]